MRFSYLIFLFILLSGLGFAQVSSEGGNVSGVNTTAEADSIWYGTCGQVYPDPVLPISFVAVPSKVECRPINTNSESCEHGIKYINLLFSNSSTTITSLSRGGLSTLDIFINQTSESASNTFVFSNSFETNIYGTITGVPTLYTNSQFASVFRMGYLQDQDGNIVIITRVVDDEIGFNGSSFDFQLILPTMNMTNTTYYVTVDLECAKPKKPSGGGGGSGIPFYNRTQPEPPGPGPGPEPGGPASNDTSCIIELYCQEWGPCEDGYRYQACIDLNNCSAIEVYRVEECAKVVPGEPEPIIPEGPIPIRVDQEFPCWPLALIILTILLLLVIYRRRRDKKRKVIQQ
jgi:hypothetical protein